MADQDKKQDMPQQEKPSKNNPAQEPSVEEILSQVKAKQETPSQPQAEESSSGEAPQNTASFSLTSAEGFGFEEQPQQPKKAKKVKKQKSRAGLVVTIVIILCLSVLLSAAILVGANDFLGLFKDSGEITVQIEKGSSTQQIAKTLHENGIIQMPLLFRAYSAVSQSDGTYQYGEYTLNTNMGYEEIVSQLQKIAPKKDVVSVTVPEGFTMRQIADELEKQGVCEANAFIDYIDRNDGQYSFEADIPREKYRFYRKEGYLFPAKYEFYLNENVSSVAERFLSNFDKQITPELKQRMEELGMSLDQTIILASLIQGESANADIMPAVSAVFHNRLKNPSEYPRLQSDITIVYVEKYIKKYITVPDQALYDAYNTYKCEGLPVGPICSPGIDAIKAALYPEDSEYYYFVNDDEGATYFAKTYAEHLKNCKIAGINPTANE